MEQTQRERENLILSRMSFVTTLGDFLTMFALIHLLYKLTGRIELAALVVTVKSLSFLLSSLVFPTLATHFNLRTLILSSQWASFGLMLFLCIQAPDWASEDSLWLLVILGFQAFLKRIFENSRESYSKNLRTENTHRSFQAQLLHAFYKAQFIGPIASLGLIYYFPIQVPLAIDAFTFFLAALVGHKLHREPHVKIKRKLLAPLKYLHKTEGLLSIFLLRSVAYWIPVGVFNYLLFGIVKEHYGLKLVQSAWVYAAIGLGSMFASHFLRDNHTHKRRWLGRISNGPLAAGALCVLAITRIAFLNLPSFSLAMLVLVISGICNGINATATQALRSHLTTNTQFPEVVALEQIVGHVVNFSVQMLCLWALSQNLISFDSGIYLSAGLLLLLALPHLQKPLRIKELN